MYCKRFCPPVLIYRHPAWGARKQSNHQSAHRQDSHEANQNGGDRRVHWQRRKRGASQRQATGPGAALDCCSIVPRLFLDCCSSSGTSSSAESPRGSWSITVSPLSPSPSSTALVSPLFKRNRILTPGGQVLLSSAFWVRLRR